MTSGALDRLLVVFTVVALLTAGGCSLFRAKGPAAPVLREDLSLLKPEEFPAKIKQLDEISRNHKSLPVRTRALFYLGLAHMHYNNPSPDYAQAAQYFDKYIALQPGNKDIDEIAAWKHTLQALDGALRETEKLKRDCALLKQQYDRANKSAASLEKKISELGQVIENQKKEMASLRETIRKLDSVQQEIERKKKGIKK